MAVTRMIDARQIKRIHALKNQLGLDDDTYRTALKAQHNVETCKNLTYIQAARFIADLEKKAGKSNHYKGNRQKYENFRGRAGMATPRQMRKVEAMWAEVSRAGTDEARASALRRFLKRIVGIEDLRFLECWQVRKVIRALDAMIKSHYKEDVN